MTVYPDPTGSLDDFSDSVQAAAKAMATRLNGGDWDTLYSKSAQIGWCRKIEWALVNLKALQNLKQSESENEKTPPID